ncbi:MAG: hypothetical protein ACLUD4_03790 [Thomasclavelia spiroformis]
MKKTVDLLNEIVAMGFGKEDALESIDSALDEVFGYENRQPIDEEEISDELYNDILLGFECEKEAC